MARLFFFAHVFLGSFFGSLILSEHVGKNDVLGQKHICYLRKILNAYLKLNRKHPPQTFLRPSQVFSFTSKIFIVVSFVGVVSAAIVALAVAAIVAV